MQLQTVQAHFSANRQEKGHLNLHHLNASQCSTHIHIQIKLNVPLVHKLSMFSCLHPPQTRFGHQPQGPEQPPELCLTPQHLSTSRRRPAPWRCSEERGSGQTPAQVIAVCALKFPLQMQPPSFPVLNCRVVLQRVVKQLPCATQRGLCFGSGCVWHALRIVREQATRALA